MEEIRVLFGRVAEVMIEECPALFGDFAAVPLEGRAPVYSTNFRKV
jgi:hypothetical protein